MARVEEVVSLVKTVKANLHSLVEEWKDFQQSFTSSFPPSHSPQPSPAQLPPPAGSPGPSTELASVSTPSPGLLLPSSAGMAPTSPILPPISPTAPGLILSQATPPVSPPLAAAGLSSTPLPMALPSASTTPPMLTTPPASDTTSISTIPPLQTVLSVPNGPPISTALSILATPPVWATPSRTTTTPALDTPSLSTTPPSGKTTPPASTTPIKSSLKVVQVSRADLDRLSAEALMLKELIPMVLNSYYISCVCRVPILETRLSEVKGQRDRELARCEATQRRCDSLMIEHERERKEKFAYKSEVGELQAMLTQQADYCSSMGSACCMLLWRVSRHEECIQTILSGSKVGEFLQLAGSTLFSFLEAYHDSAPPDETHPEAQFVLALCGTITNIAASTYGRDYLCTCEDGRGLIDTLCSVLGTAPVCPQYAKLRNLILMTLYNLSINQRGVSYLTARERLLPDLVRLLKEENDSVNRLHTLRLIQSLILEQENVEFLCQAVDLLPVSLLQHFTTDLNTEVQSTAAELLRDLATIRRHVS